MLKQIYKNKLTVNYRDIGHGATIILIHGFLETLKIWSGFDEFLAEKFRVICIDLPGHGKSDLHESPFTMCKYADSVKDVMYKENINKALIIGHSMGGYVSLAFAENFPEMLSGLCLFHSSPFSDDNQKKTARSQTIERVEKGESDIICRDHVRAVYANENTDKFSDAVNQAEKAAKKLTKKGIIASIISMRDRNDRSLILKNLKVPLLYVLGMKDNFISQDILNKIEMPIEYDVLKLEESGHMGMTEEPEKSAKSIIDFYNKTITL